ncbi:jg21723 [Pararge aegeria aegeria]|uniref:Jg21723 protein n=1 Tax=Pararge aegeria aegeria TaxID=348720 RepID=A0A8S4SFJ2_9NEOP|nr:jg21723 [Pararge aegeria aegeria]
MRRPEVDPEAKRAAASPPSAHTPVPRLADYVWGARLPLPYAIPWLKPTLWSPGALTALSGVSAIEEPRAFRPVRSHRLESPQLSPVVSPQRSPNRSPATSPRQTRSPLRSPVRSPIRSSVPSSPARSSKSDRDSDESVDIETTEEDQAKDVFYLPTALFVVSRIKRVAGLSIRKTKFQGDSEENDWGQWRRPGRRCGEPCIVFQ